MERCRPNLRDEVVALLALLETTEGHLGTRDELLGVLEVLELYCETWLAVARLLSRARFTHERVLVPGNTGTLVGVGVGVAVDLTGLTAEETVELGADLVGTTFLDGVALGATGLKGG